MYLQQGMHPMIHSQSRIGAAVFPTPMMANDVNYTYISYHVPAYVQYAEVYHSSQQELPMHVGEVPGLSRSLLQAYSLPQGGSRSSERQGRNTPKRQQFIQEHKGLSARAIQDKKVDSVKVSFDAELTVDQIKHKVLRLARDSRGCRFLQAVLEDPNTDPALKSTIFDEAKPELKMLIGEPLGNYFFQKLFEMSLPDLQKSILLDISDILVEACTGIHSTRSVQKIIMVSSSNIDIVKALVEILEPHVLSFCFDANACHVIQCCLRFFPFEETMFIIRVVKLNCMVLAKNRHGCRIVQRCLEIEVNLDHDSQMILADRTGGNSLLNEVLNHTIVLIQVSLHNSSPPPSYYVKFIVLTSPLGFIWELCSSIYLG